MDDIVRLILGSFAALLPLLLIMARRRRRPPTQSTATDAAKPATGEYPTDSTAEDGTKQQDDGRRGTLTGRPLVDLPHTLHPEPFGYEHRIFERVLTLERVVPEGQSQPPDGSGNAETASEDSLGQRRSTRQYPTVAVPPSGRHSGGRSSRLHFSNRYSELQRAIILSEILGQPKGLQ